MDKEERKKKVQKSMQMISYIDGTLLIVLGLAIHARFGGRGEPIFDVLNNDNVVNMMFIISVPIIAWCTFKVFVLSGKLQRIEEE